MKYREFLIIEKGERYEVCYETGMLVQKDYSFDTLEEAIECVDEIKEEQYSCSDSYLDFVNNEISFLR